MKLEEVSIEASWKHQLKEEFSEQYFEKIVHYLKSEIRQGKTIYPPGPLIFNAFDKTPFKKVKVVILGQDPYHGPGQAMGLSFSVPRNKSIPASLKNIYKELNSDLNIPVPSHGDLSGWANQGVFLLNAMLTVEHKQAGSHKKIGWQNFTDAVIKKLSDSRKNIVFLLWGNFAKNKRQIIDEMNHYVLEAAHPSPLAGGKFFGSKHFSKTNELLIKNNISPINWNLSEQ